MCFFLHIYRGGFLAYASRRELRIKGGLTCLTDASGCIHNEFYVLAGGYTSQMIDRYITSLASALTANVTREAKRGRCIKRPGNTDTAKQAHIASLETAVKAHIQRKRIRPKRRCTPSMHDWEPNNSQATGRVGSVEKVLGESEDKAKGGYIKAKSEQLSKSCQSQMSVTLCHPVRRADWGPLLLSWPVQHVAAWPNARTPCQVPGVLPEAN